MHNVDMHMEMCMDMHMDMCCVLTTSWHLCSQPPRRYLTDPDGVEVFGTIDGPTSPPSALPIAEFATNKDGTAIFDIDAEHKAIQTLMRGWWPDTATR